MGSIKVVYPYTTEGSWVEEVECNNCGNILKEYEDSDYHWGHNETTTNRLWRCKCGNSETIRFEW